jgi:Fe2+ transport system protein FeoA
MVNQIMTVAMMREGDEGTVQSIAGKEGLTSRLASMGIVPGISIRVLRNSGGSVIVLASGTRLALGRGEASRIVVAQAGAAPEKKRRLIALA